MTKSKHSRSRITTSESSLCQFSFADGRTCRMFRQHDHPFLCIFHARAERQIAESDDLGSELAATLTGRFMTATDINYALGKLYKAIAQNRITPRNASNLAFSVSSCSSRSTNSRKNWDSATTMKSGRKCI